MIKVFALERGLISASGHRYIVDRIYKVCGRVRLRGILLFLWSRAVKADSSKSLHAPPCLMIGHLSGDVHSWRPSDVVHRNHW